VKKANSVGCRTSHLRFDRLVFSFWHYTAAGNGSRRCSRRPV